VVIVGESLLCCCPSWCGFYFMLLMFWFCGNGVGECVCVLVGAVVGYLYLFAVVYLQRYNRFS
jgi:hypothetical protein